MGLCGDIRICIDFWRKGRRDDYCMKHLTGDDHHVYREDPSLHRSSCWYYRIPSSSCIIPLLLNLKLFSFFPARKRVNAFKFIICSEATVSSIISSLKRFTSSPILFYSHVEEWTSRSVFWWGRQSGRGGEEGLQGIQETVVIVVHGEDTSCNGREESLYRSCWWWLWWSTEDKMMLDRIGGGCILELVSCLDCKLSWYYELNKRAESLELLSIFWSESRLVSRAQPEEAEKSSTSQTSPPVATWLHPPLASFSLFHSSAVLATHPSLTSNFPASTHLSQMTKRSENLHVSNSQKWESSSFFPSSIQLNLRAKIQEAVSTDKSGEERIWSRGEEDEKISKCRNFFVTAIHHVSLYLVQLNQWIQHCYPKVKRWSSLS